MNYDAILFDYDGTVADSIADIAYAANRALRLAGLPEREEAEYRSFAGSGAGVLLRRAAPAGTDGETLRALYDDYVAYYADHANDRSRPYDGVPEMLSALKEAGRKLAVISNKPDAAVQRLVAEFFPGLFNAVAGERDGVRRKPAPDTVNEVMSALGVTPDECVYVGDSEVDVETAANAKTACVCVSWGYRSAAALKAAGAKTIVDTTEELADTLLG